MKQELRWVYVYEAHVIGIGHPVMHSMKQDGYAGQWQVLVLPDWMSAAFLTRLTTAAIGDIDPISYVEIVALESQLIMGEHVRSLVTTNDWQPERYYDDLYSRVQSSIPPSDGEYLAHTRILLDGVLIWGREEYPGERRIVIPKVRIPKKLRRGIPALEDGSIE